VQEPYGAICGLKAVAKFSVNFRPNWDAAELALLVDAFTFTLLHCEKTVGFGPDGAFYRIQFSPSLAI
jgi:hypothetical protein